MRVYGIRHHGPGSARSLLAALGDQRPDCVLIEGPSDANEQLAMAAHAEMVPPLALMGYQDDNPAQCVFFPFAAFSPEWQALRWALAEGVPVRFIDLPTGELLYRPSEDEAPDALPTTVVVAEEQEPTAPAAQDEAIEQLRCDPLSLLAEAAGYDDAERWWEDVVEQRSDAHDAFVAISEAMAEIRAAVGDVPAGMDAEREQRREAYMRWQIGEAMRAGHERIAVVCGAWHAPVLADAPQEQQRPPRARAAKTTVTWVPWTHGRLAQRSGYGAGVAAPGWYEHLFDHPEQTVVRWLGRVGQLLRERDADLSTAHVIEATRTAHSLAALRERPAAGLSEINDALEVVIGEGAQALLAMVHERLIVGERLGGVCEDVPTVPLARDLRAQQRSLRLAPKALVRELELDLRKPNDLRRSHLLHRLRALGINWGQPVEVRGAKGTFRESWQLQWQPEFEVAVVEASVWGPTVELAAGARLADAARSADDLAALTELLGQALLAELPDALSVILLHFEIQAAVADDVLGLLRAIAPLARSARYGSVRNDDAQSLAKILGELTTRAAIGLPSAASVDDEAAQALLAAVASAASALATLDDDELSALWHDSLRRLIARHDAHTLLVGRAVRLLRDAGQLHGDEVAAEMDRVLSLANAPLASAAWLEGFLANSGLALVHDDALLGLIDGWLGSVDADHFQTVLPVLRRTFSTFAAPERRSIGERVRSTASSSSSSVTATRAASASLDSERAALVIPVLQQIFGGSHEQS